MSIFVYFIFNNLSFMKRLFNFVNKLIEVKLNSSDKRAVHAQK